MIAHVRTSDGLPQPLDMHCRNVRLLCAQSAPTARAESGCLQHSSPSDARI